MQFFQTAQGYGPFEAGLRKLPWTGMPMLITPIAGLLSIGALVALLVPSIRARQPSTAAAGVASGVATPPSAA